MDVSAIFRAVLTPEKDRNAENFAKLSVGERIVGRVLHVESDGRALIDMGRFRAMAHTTMPVRVGQKLPLTVIRTGEPTQLRLDTDAFPGNRPAGPQVALLGVLSGDELANTMKSIDRVIDALTQNGSKLAQAMTGKNPVGQMAGALNSTDVSGSTKGSAAQPLWRSEQVQQALIQLKTAMKPMPMDGAVSQQTQWVQSAVENNGILFELKLAQAVENGEASLPGRTATASTNLSQPQAHAAGQAPGSVPSNAKPGGLLETSVLADERRSNSMAGDAHVTTQAAGKRSQVTPEGMIQPANASANGSTQSSTANIGIGTADGAGLKSVQLPTGAVSVESGFSGLSDNVPTDNSQSDANLAGDVLRQIAGKDLKPQLMILKNFFTAVDDALIAEMGMKSKDVATLRQSVERMLNHVEQQQEKAVRHAGEPDLFQVFTHILPVKDQATPLRLKVYYPKKGSAAQSDQRHRVALLLDMDEIGMVRADLSMEGSVLRINFFVSDDSVRVMFEQHAQNLNERLEGEFEQVFVGTQVSREKIAQFEGEDLTGPPLGKIDLKA